MVGADAESRDASRLALLSIGGARESCEATRNVVSIRVREYCESNNVLNEGERYLRDAKPDPFSAILACRLSFVIST